MSNLFPQYMRVKFPRFMRVLAFLRNLLLVGTYHEPDAPTEQLIALTQQSWDKRLGHPVDEKQAREIIRSFRNFLQLVREVKQNERQR